MKVEEDDGNHAIRYSNYSGFKAQHMIQLIILIQVINYIRPNGVKDGIDNITKLSNSTWKSIIYEFQ